MIKSCQWLVTNTLSFMQHSIRYERLLITDCSGVNTDFARLFVIFRATLKPDMRFAEFRQYYCSAKLEYIDATLVMAGNEAIGFCAAAFYTLLINNGKYTIGRAATGILPVYQGNSLPKWQLYRKYMRYWLRHPFTKIILSAYVANPVIYAMICKYTGIAYPRRNAPAPPHIVQLKDKLLKSQRLTRREKNEFVVELHFDVSIGIKEQERIFTSKNRNILYFLQINPAFRQKQGVVVIIPVNLQNIFLSMGRFFYYCMLQKIMSKIWNEIFQLLHRQKHNLT